MKNRRNSGIFSMGAVLLLTTLLVLLLTAFSLLTLQDARMEHRQAQVLAQRTTGYYAACNRAEEIISHLKAGEDPGHPLETGEGSIRFRVPLEEGQVLTVELAPDYTILRWQVENLP